LPFHFALPRTPEHTNNLAGPLYLLVQISHFEKVAYIYTEIFRDFFKKEHQIPEASAGVALVAGSMVWYSFLVFGGGDCESSSSRVFGECL
jgi:hypothetical protein